MEVLAAYTTSVLATVKGACGENALMLAAYTTSILATVKGGLW